jgi:hypothetical protein
VANAYTVAIVKNKHFLILYKLFFSLLGFAAIVTEIAVITERGAFNGVNFFSYFTVQANIVVAAAFLVSALVVASGKAQRWLDTLRAATTVYALVVGTVFSALLAGYDALTAVPWDNVILHYVMPVAVLADFVFDRPSRRLRFTASLVWMAYPLLYVGYSLTRGAVTGWYPYPFLNIGTKGIGAVMITVAGLAVFGTFLIAVVTWLTKWPRKESYR